MGAWSSDGQMGALLCVGSSGNHRVVLDPRIRWITRAKCSEESYQQTIRIYCRALPTCCFMPPQPSLCEDDTCMHSKVRWGHLDDAEITPRPCGVQPSESSKVRYGNQVFYIIPVCHVFETLSGLLLRFWSGNSDFVPLKFSEHFPWVFNQREK